jgi:hypothetical protein
MGASAPNLVRVQPMSKLAWRKQYLSFKLMKYAHWLQDQ